ncbi:hypothetical protein [Erysipelothrix anatis]|uniref:hypothetical protein n=1 Tax=Erysipelothrix anatis TaxID=2683713 RepID=UPI001357C790|nr:hypothetical protein [Erysipelothrix anatis]
MEGYYKRVNVDVELIYNASGKIHLLAMYWGDKRFEITEFESRSFVKSQTGYTCEMYLATIDGKQKKIYFSEGLFFVEIVR